MDIKSVSSAGRNSIMYYRGPKSRKPYKVRFIRILYPITDAEAKTGTSCEIVDYKVEIEFSTMKKDTVKASHLFSTWDDAEKVAKIRDKSIQESRIVEIVSGKTILFENGKEERGIDIRLGNVEAAITTKEAHILWTEIGKSLGYCVNTDI